MIDSKGASPTPVEGRLPSLGLVEQDQPLRRRAPRRCRAPISATLQRDRHRPPCPAGPACRRNGLREVQRRAPSPPRHARAARSPSASPPGCTRSGTGDRSTPLASSIAATKSSQVAACAVVALEIEVGAGAEALARRASCASCGSARRPCCRSSRCRSWRSRYRFRAAPDAPAGPGPRGIAPREAAARPRSA